MPESRARLPGVPAAPPETNRNLPGCTAPSACSHLRGSREPGPSPDCGGPPAAPCPLAPCPQGCTTRARTPAPRQSLTSLAVPSWRLPFGDDVPPLTSGSADQLITRGPPGVREVCAREAGARAGPATPSGRERAPMPRPPTDPAYQPGDWRVGTFSATGLRMDTVPPCFVSMHFSCHSHRTLPAKGAVER